MAVQVIVKDDTGMVVNHYLGGTMLIGLNRMKPLIEGQFFYPAEEGYDSFASLHPEFFDERFLLDKHDVYSLGLTILRSESFHIQETEELFLHWKEFQHLYV